MSTQLNTATFYDETYKQPNYFRYPIWLYEPYVSSLIKLCGLQKGTSVLDVGCGQGFFSYLFGKRGMRVHGIDISETGINTARKLYGKPGITFAVADIETVTFPELFDCIFVRSCSLYNTETFRRQDDTTKTLLKHLKTGGTFIFVYNSNLSTKTSPKWRYHSLDDVRDHFSAHPSAKVFFLSKLTTYLFRAHSFTRLVGQFNANLSKVSGLGGDIVCIFRKDPGFVQSDTGS